MKLKGKKLVLSAHEQHVVDVWLANQANVLTDRIRRRFKQNVDLVSGPDHYLGGIILRGTLRGKISALVRSAEFGDKPKKIRLLVESMIRKNVSRALAGYFVKVLQTGKL